ncbi:hypothetical protein GGP41_009011 [Bipolaris sorokiniana]|uniref:Uncharacterized protein n=1 Tax=Cochliobolus sativus TaxID=45130 RepID=A0A8H5ZGQ0_COCSA|nr:hypothetical protein GGP41_009011 [Bipolaris sorokiniana]
MPPKAQPPPRDKLRRVYAENVRRIFNYFCRPRGNSPYDAVFGLGSHNYLPMIILTSRPPYLKAFIMYSCSALNAAFYINNCAAILQGEKKFTVFAGCVSIAIPHIEDERKRLPSSSSSSN